jgi:hypothetical protein
MSPLKTSLFAALGSAALTVGGFYFVHHSRASEAVTLRAANRQMRFEASRRGQAQPAAEGAEVAPGDDPELVRTDAPAPRQTPIGDYRNEGQATPLATLQTFAWACDRGDTETVRGLLCFEGAGRAKVEAFMAALPANLRGPWTTPEEMAAELLTSDGMNHPFPKATILEKATFEKIGEERVILRLPGTSHARTDFQKTAAGWSYLITEAVVDDYIGRNSQAQAKP